ncbi:hypothetical protein [Citrobacter portucalensis]|uniref:hypothetical protein n=1 Tax=Citrobacter portucalensis TaxID=1639133 RepID=UPI003CF80DFE
MKKDIVLSIVVGSLVAAGMVNTACAAEASGKASQVQSKAPTSSGKCASGKCGTEKIYSQATLQHDPQEQLVRARDGKCGLTGAGIAKNEASQPLNAEKCVSGVCGK